MNIENIEKGMVFKNWKEFCKAIDIECKKSNNRKGDERKLSSLLRQSSILFFFNGFSGFI